MEGRASHCGSYDWMALDPTKPPSFIPLESKVQQQNQSNFGRAEGLEGMSEEGAKFCQFGLNGNPRDFLCSPLPPYLHSMIQFYPFLRSAAEVVQKQRESAAAVLYPHARTWKISSSLLLSVSHSGLPFSHAARFGEGLLLTLFMLFWSEYPVSVVKSRHR